MKTGWYMGLQEGEAGPDWPDVDDLDKAVARLATTDSVSAVQAREDLDVTAEAFCRGGAHADRKVQEDMQAEA